MKWVTSKVRRLWLWVRSCPKKVTIPIMIVILVALSFGTFQFIHFYNYTQHDPNFCTSCHIMTESWDRWATSEHKDIECHTCHNPGIFVSTMMVVDFIFGSYERVERHTLVQDEVCSECHQSGSPQWIQVAATAGHQMHADEQNISCTTCHAVTIHRFSPPGSICNVCHEDKSIIGPMANMHCLNCHEFLVVEEQLIPQRKDYCLDCHQALTDDGVGLPTDAPMQYACGDCHQPHQEAQQVLDCLSCHTVEGLHLEGEHGATSCVTCHEPHEWRVTERETCLACHTGRTEHYAPYSCSTAGACHSFPGSEN